MHLEEPGWWMWLLQVVCTVYPLTDITRFVVVAVGAGVGIVSILVLWTIRLYDADDSDTVVNQCVVVAVGAGVGVVSVLVSWTIRLHDADDSVIGVQIVNLGHA